MANTNSSASFWNSLLLLLGGKETQAQTQACQSAACTGLECLERPRFFAGQLLTEAELNRGLSYLQAKNRLHNRYLHGWGVVCGLQVICHECQGWVTVKSGYAIDPCGADIVVCKDHSVNILEEIGKCREARRRKRGECDPYEPAWDESCKEIAENWCVTLAYEEQEARPITALRRDPTDTCGSPCSGLKKEAAAAAVSPCTGGVAASASGTATSAPCEPTRVLESYRLAVVEAPKDHCGDLKSLLEDTLLGRVVKCLSTLAVFLGTRIPPATWKILAILAFTPGTTTPALLREKDIPPQALRDACCYLRQAVFDLYTQNPLSVRCAAVEVLDEILCAPAASAEVALEQTTASLWHLAGLLLQYILDCVCQALLPPCTPDPKDNRLILACLTIRGDKIVRICNFSCRRHAGSFPAVHYWLSLVPVLPLLGLLAQALCCQPEMVRAQSPLKNELLGLLAKIDPTGKIRQAIGAEGFALPKMYAGQVKKVLNKISLAGLAGVIVPEAVNLPSHMDKSPAQVQKALKKARVSYITREVASLDEVPALGPLTTSPFAAPGEKVMIYTMKNKVVGYSRVKPQEELAAKQTELETIKAELAGLKKEVASLRRPG